MNTQESESQRAACKRLAFCELRASDASLLREGTISTITRGRPSQNCSRISFVEITMTRRRPDSERPNCVLLLACEWRCSSAEVGLGRGRRRRRTIAQHRIAITIGRCWESRWRRCGRRLAMTRWVQIKGMLNDEPSTARVSVILPFIDDIVL